MYVIYIRKLSCSPNNWGRIILWTVTESTVYMYVDIYIPVYKWTEGEITRFICGINVRLNVSVLLIICLHNLKVDSSLGNFPVCLEASVGSYMYVWQIVVFLSVDLWFSLPWFAQSCTMQCTHPTRALVYVGWGWCKLMISLWVNLLHQCQAYNGILLFQLQPARVGGNWVTYLLKVTCKVEWML